MRRICPFSYLQPYYKLPTKCNYLTYHKLVVAKFSYYYCMSTQNILALSIPVHFYESLVRRDRSTRTSLTCVLREERNRTPSRIFFSWKIVLQIWATRNNIQNSSRCIWLRFIAQSTGLLTRGIVPLINLLRYFAGSLFASLSLDNIGILTTSGPAGLLRPLIAPLRA
ncbi:hypothetical protein K445DRAFT_105348 [Daldinia sp. EC12]|nr:hypothetical protein F4774DRAFT_111644 [Daldinia eschscholtzii]OTB15986.1 hypothetical protein K445DRAFT_105348 [Daldinia sp. EC12]